MTYKAQGMTHDEILDELGVDSPSSITSSLEKLKIRLYNAEWKPNVVSRHRFITYAPTIAIVPYQTAALIKNFLFEIIVIARLFVCHDNLAILYICKSISK